MKLFVDQVTAEPAGPAQFSAPLPVMTVPGATLRRPVWSPLVSSIVSTNGSWVIRTPFGRAPPLLLRKVASNMNAAATVATVCAGDPPAKYRLVCPGDPGNADQVKCVRMISGMVAPRRDWPCVAAGFCAGTGSRASDGARCARAVLYRWGLR